MTVRGLTIVVAGGAWGRSRPIPPADFVIAADSGLDRAEALGVPVDLVVGDFDSVQPATLAAARARGVAVEQHPSAKDKTDLELAVDRALERGARRVLLIALEGGRADHALANLLLLASQRYAGIELEAWTDRAVITVVRGRREYEWAIGDTVSLLAVSGAAHGVTTHGLEYPLRGETLTVGSSRGVSNVVVATPVVVVVETGVLLAIRNVED